MLFIYLLLFLCFSIVTILCYRIFCIFFIKKKKHSLNTLKQNKTMIVLGSGGHTAEMFRILRGIDSSKYLPRIYVKASGDNMSANHCLKFENAQNNNNKSNKDYKIIDIPRAREVGQSYFSSIFTTLYAIFYCIKLIYVNSPDLIICNGPGTCVPICYSAILKRVLFGKNTTIIYVESICRVKDLSLSGKLLYPICDLILVQWKELQEKYSKTEYIGLLST